MQMEGSGRILTLFCAEKHQKLGTPGSRWRQGPLSAGQGSCGVRPGRYILYTHTPMYTYIYARCPIWTAHPRADEDEPSMVVTPDRWQDTSPARGLR